LAYHRAPMIFRLQLVALNAAPAWHTPFHRLGTGPYPWSSKLRDSGHMPATPIELRQIELQARCQLEHCQTQTGVNDAAGDVS